MRDLRELLWEYALRTLDEADRRELEAALQRDPVLRAELAEIRDLASELALALPPVTPSASVKTRLLSSVQVSRAEPFSPWLEKFARILDVGLERARELLARAYDPGAWKHGGIEGLSIIKLRGGPRTESAMICLVRMVPGFRFPRHRHGGQEISLIFQGGYRDSLGGLAVRAGDIITHPAGSEHDFVVDPGEDCIGVTAIHGTCEVV